MFSSQSEGNCGNSKALCMIYYNDFFLLLDHASFKIFGPVLFHSEYISTFQLVLCPTATEEYVESLSFQCAREKVNTSFFWKGRFCLASVEQKSDGRLLICLQNEMSIVFHYVPTYSMGGAMLSELNSSTHNINCNSIL